MGGDRGGGSAGPKRPRALERACVGWPRPLGELKDLLYEAYLAAGAPSLDEITRDIAIDDGMPGAPSRDTVRRCISDPSRIPNQADAVSIALALAGRARWDAKSLSARVRDLWVAAQMAAGVGRRIGEFDDQLILADLEVHPALVSEGGQQRLGALPAYVAREFDAQLATVAAAAASGQSGVSVLVGGSSTGKTRAMWEAVKQLPADWRLWHPLSPTRPDAILAELADVAPRTVVWLNEAQYYLGPDLHGERVAAGLRSLLHDTARGPVLVLAALWPEHWRSLTTRTDPDRHAQARQLLDGHKIDVPDAFYPADLTALTNSVGTDPRLAEAIERALDGQVTQYLAGVPVLTARYHAAPVATRALIHAAMDARRLGAGPHIPLAWLADAAPGYLTDAQWNTTADDWLSEALDYVTQECSGIPGILTPVKTTIRNQRNSPRWLPECALRSCKGRTTSWPTISTSTAAVPVPSRSRPSTSGLQPLTTPILVTWVALALLPGTVACSETPPNSTNTPLPVATFRPPSPLSAISTRCIPPTVTLRNGLLPMSISIARTRWPSCWTP